MAFQPCHSLVMMPRSTAFPQQLFERVFTRVLELEKQLAEKTTQLDDNHATLQTIHSALGRILSNTPDEPVGDIASSKCQYANFKPITCRVRSKIEKCPRRWILTARVYLQTQTSVRGMSRCALRRRT